MAIPRFMGKSGYIGTNPADPYPLTYTNQSAWSVATTGGRRGSSDVYHRCAPSAGQSTYASWAITSAVTQIEFMPIAFYVETGIESGDTADIMGFHQSTNEILRITLDDALQPKLYALGTLIGTLPALTASKWYQFYIMTQCATAGQSKDWFRLWVRGDDDSYRASMVQDLTSRYDTAVDSVWFGRRNTPTESTPPVFRFCDGIHFNSTGSSNNTEPPNYRRFYVNDHKPMAVTPNGWTDNADDGTDLHQCLDDRPATGVAGPGDIIPVGTSNIVTTNGGAPGAITPHASTANGDLMIWYHYSAVTGGNETVSPPTGFTSICNFVSANNGLVACAYRVKQSGDTTFTATNFTNHTSGTGGESVIEFIETFRGQDVSSPIGDASSALSTASAATTSVGPIAATGVSSVPTGACLVVFAGRHDDLGTVSQTQLTGDGLTWAVSNTEETTTGADAAAFTQHGFNASGSAVAPTSKTITIPTADSATSAGVMFVIKKKKGTPAKSQMRLSPYFGTVAIVADVGVQSYSEIGIGSSDTIRLVQAWSRHGHEGQTGQFVWVEQYSNPSGSALLTDTYGTANPANTDSTGTPEWKTSKADHTAVPSVVLSTRPVVRMGVYIGSGACLIDQGGMYSIHEQVTSLPPVPGPPALGPQAVIRAL